MKSRHLVDPELLPALDAMAGFDDSYALENLSRLRREMLEMYAAVWADAEPEPAIESYDIVVRGPWAAPPVRLVIYRHKDGRVGRPAYYYVHGGGFIMGAPEMADSWNRILARELNCAIVSVDYRLAPETTFPGNVEDCYAGLRWLFAHAAEIGADPQCIAIGGESAGGGLAAALGLMVRDRGEIPIIHQQLIYPMLDDRSCLSAHPFTGEFGWTREKNRMGWEALLGQPAGSEDVSPYAAAARAQNLSGLPSTFIGIGTLDLFLEENVDYAMRLTAAGVPVDLRVYAGAFHGSDLVRSARLSRQHWRDQVEALRAAFDRRQAAA